MKEIYTARDTMEAHFLKGLLERDGIAAVVEGEAISSGFGVLPEHQPTVWVKDEDVARASVIVEELKRRDKADAQENWTPPKGAPWKCPKCGELIEPQFAQCWHCGANSPAGEGPAA